VNEWQHVIWASGSCRTIPLDSSQSGHEVMVCGVATLNGNSFIDWLRDSFLKEQVRRRGEKDRFAGEQPQERPFQAARIKWRSRFIGKVAALSSFLRAKPPQNGPDRYIHTIMQSRKCEPIPFPISHSQENQEYISCCALASATSPWSLQSIEIQFFGLYMVAKALTSALRFRIFAKSNFFTANGQLFEN
jgi:hypothetical protein